MIFAYVILTDLEAFDKWGAANFLPSFRDMGTCLNDVWRHPPDFRECHWISGS